MCTKDILQEIPSNNKYLDKTMYLLIWNGSKKLWNSHNELYNATILKEWLKQNMTQFGYSNLNFVNKKHIHRYTCWHVHLKLRKNWIYLSKEFKSWRWGKANFSFYMSLPYMIFTMCDITFNFLNKHTDIKGKKWYNFKWWITYYEELFRSITI